MCPGAIDFSGVTDMVAIDSGDYVCTVTGAKFVEKSKSSGNPFVTVEFTVDDENHVEENGRKVWRNYSLQQQSLFAIKQMMVAAGADPELFSGPVDLEEELPLLFGNHVIVAVSQREFNNEMKNQVDKVRALEAFM